MKIVANSHKAKRAYFVFSAFAEKEPLVGLGEDPYRPENTFIRTSLRMSTSFHEMLGFDKALARFGDDGWVEKSYRFECPTCGIGNDAYGDNNFVLNPPGEVQMCKARGCSVPYDKIGGILWNASGLLDTKAVQDAELRMFIAFNDKVSGMAFDVGFVRQYAEFIGGKIDGDLLKIRARNVSRMKGSEGLIEKLSFVGSSLG